MTEEAGETEHHLLKGQGHWLIQAGLVDYPLSSRNNIGLRGHNAVGNTYQIRDFFTSIAIANSFSDFFFIKIYILNI